MSSPLKTVFIWNLQFLIEQKSIQIHWKLLAENWCLQCSHCYGICLKCLKFSISLNFTKFFHNFKFSVIFHYRKCYYSKRSQCEYSIRNFPLDVKMCSKSSRTKSFSWFIFRSCRINLTSIEILFVSFKLHKHIFLAKCTVNICKVVCISHCKWNRLMFLYFVVEFPSIFHTWN